MAEDKVQGMFISYAGSSLFNTIRKRTVKVSSFRSLDSVREYLKSGTPVKVYFDRNDRGFKSRMIPFIQGMSSYFGATTTVFA